MKQEVTDCYLITLAREVKYKGKNPQLHFSLFYFANNWDARICVKHFHFLMRDLFSLMSFLYTGNVMCNHNIALKWWM